MGVTNRPDSKKKNSYPHIYFVELWVGVFVKYRIASRSEAAKSASRGLDLARSPGIFIKKNKKKKKKKKKNKKK